MGKDRGKDVESALWFPVFKGERINDHHLTLAEKRRAKELKLKYKKVTMFESVTQSELRSQMEQHLLMLEEVLGGMDIFVRRLELRITRIEEGLGLEPEGISASGWVADLQRLKADVARLRRHLD
ncbi:MULTISPECIES: hypothetical protein [Pseudomonadaceae]|uniref:Uncharacterized protein n=2 Tax=Pseudomonadaceae TaxID=135621 RepID=A0AA37CKK0_AQUAC|nr:MULTISPECIES: hypothetical protein [Pseudomonadaceae]MDH0423777.1 hypothetical protein [Stutzerimonas stutzeri]BCR24428.1 hypothetical protein KAM426_19550 [Pseudomonas alcaligenes]GIZ69223.1 hypothetical protein KAM428_43080 [Pseudomonas alcaligenes]GIZ77936.1 hypothetical protein KAM430_43450 [Pseudomonas alcaligenes]GIZ82293.1 hypothetical protein KAM432_43410 [Pseudomonas alcaligenes]